MLTVKQSTTYGFKSVHDLPTPPSSSRHSPPLSFAQENIHSLRQLPVPSRHSPSPPPQTMANQHRGLPPPAAMALPPQLTPTTVAPMPHHHHGSLSQQQQQQQPHHPPPSQVPQSHVHHTLSGTTLPTPTSQWQEESLRNWLQARSEEERTKQEEEKTKQENIRLEQRRLEVDILQHSIRGGIPPPMIPLVFAGMGRDGQLPQSVLEWTQQFMHNPQGHLPQLMPPQPVSPQHHRDPSVQSHGQYQPAAGAAVPSVPPSGQAPQGYGQHSGSPNRSRPLSIGHSMGGSNLPGLNTSIPLSHQGASNHMQGQMGQQEPGSGLYFHHWQPPTSHSGASTNRPASPSGDPPKKRKAAGAQQPGGTPTEQRLKSPPPFSQPPNASSRRGHKRQKSDMSWYQSTSSTQDRAEEQSERQSRPSSPSQSSRPTFTRERSRSEVGKHSVSSMLSTEPTEPKEEHSRPWQSSGHSTSYHSPTEGDQRGRHGLGIEHQQSQEHGN